MTAITYRQFLLPALLAPVLSYGYSNAQDDSLSTNSGSKLFKLNGIELTNRHHYGFIPLLFNSAYPGYYTELEGRANIDIGSLPFQSQGYYSSQAFVSGIRNQFTVNFDADEYKRRLQNDALKRVNELKDSVSNIDSKQQKLLQRKEYLKFRKENPYKTIPIPEVDKLPDLNKPDFDTTLLSRTPDLNTPSLSLNENTSLNDVKVPDLSLEEIDLELEKLKLTREKLINTINILERKSEFPEENGLIGKLKSFNLGLSSPEFSQFLISGLPINGAFVELEDSKHYFAFAAGITQLNFMPVSLTPEQHLDNSRNTFNFFDFNFSNGNKVTAIKSGIGRKSGTHLYGGVLLGKGQGFHNHENVDLKDKNIVFEIDGQVLIGKRHRFNVIAARSFIRSDSIPLPVSPVGEEDLSYAVSVLYNLSLKKTEIELSGRYIMPHFKSFGVGFMRSDNQRLQASIRHQLFKWIRIGGLYRHESDNLKNLYEVKNTLDRWGADVIIRPTRKLTLSGSYLPVTYSATHANGETLVSTRNLISTALISWTHSIKKIPHLINVTYSDVKFSTDSMDVHYENAMIMSILNLSKSITNSFSSSLILTNSLDSMASDLLLLRNEVSVDFRKSIRASLAYKHSFSERISDKGFKVTLDYLPVKSISLSASVERIIRGEYIFSMGQDFENKPPYYAQLLIRYIWQK